ncbi:MAG: aspartate aminotransferase family protein [Steroidobacteraceae bacterium]|nr:aspartate aminotransferase family protein [Steroidobacteraceae bacterium]
MGSPEFTLTSAEGAGKFPDSTSRSAALYARAAAVLPGGNSRHSVYFPPYPIYAHRGRGSRIWDVDGIERLDCVNNYSSLIHGHSHPAIVEAISRQAAELISVALPTESEVLLAELLIERLEAVERIRFCNSGTEAVMFALKAARAFTGRPLVAKIEGAYHGSGETASVSTMPDPARWGDREAPAAVPDSGSGPGVGHDVVVLSMNDVERGRRLIRANADRLAGVLIDPMVKNLAFMAATPEFVAMLREETERCGALLIFDEVYSLRLGFHGAHATLGVKPDVVALGKIIGGGLPIGAVGGRADLMDQLFDPRVGAKLAHAGTFNANPLTMAAGVAAMKHFDETAFDRLGMLGERLRTGLREALRISGRAGTVTGAASMIGLFMTDSKIHNYRDLVTALIADPGIKRRGDALFRQLLNRGVFMGSQGFFVLSTANTAAEIDRIIEAVADSLRFLPE